MLKVIALLIYFQNYESSETESELYGQPISLPDQKPKEDSNLPNESGNASANEPTIDQLMQTISEMKQQYHQLIQWQVMTIIFLQILVCNNHSHG